MKRLIIPIVIVLVTGGGQLYAAGGTVTSPTGVAPDRYTYYPGTEELGPDEMRVVACGTGMPSARHSQAFGKIMSTIKPKHAVAYHFFNEAETRYGIYAGVRETYDGPLSMATDLMTWNITRDGVEERMATATEEAWSVEGPVPAPNNEAEDDPNRWMSQEILSGAWDVSDAEGQMLMEYMEKYNLDPAMFQKPKQ